MGVLDKEKKTIGRVGTFAIYLFWAHKKPVQSGTRKRMTRLLVPFK